MEMSSKSGLSNLSGTTSLSAKLKRMQIEESLLLQSIGKCVSEVEQTHEICPTNYLKASEFSTFSAKITNSFREIKLIFQDIKTSTSSKQILKSIDIDDVKRNTIELENSIKTLKSYLQSEQTVLKCEEQHLNQDLNEKAVAINKFKRHPKIQTAKYNECVPSPVKTMMNSPFKCPEVQQFQEFMMHSTNRYGGWNEYHHNIFVNQWFKYFGPHIDTFSDGSEDCLKKSSTFQLFLSELSPKLDDISEEEIITHVKWYSNYIYLKKRQQTAIDKWRYNRTIIKSARVDPNLKKDRFVRNRSTGRKNPCGPADIDYITVSDDLNATKHLVSKFRKQDKVSCFVRECMSDTNGSISHENTTQNFWNTNVRNQILDGCGQPDLTDTKAMSYQKPTKEWNNKVNSEDMKPEINLNNLENIKTLGIPIWRAGL